LKKGVNKTFDEDISPQILICDASESIHNGFKKTFGESSTVIMCWAHMKRNVQKKAEQLVKPKEHIKELLSDLDKLQLCHSDDIFKNVLELFLDKWAVQKESVSYFRKQWVDKNNNWYEGSGLLIPSTNNRLESWNRVIKDEHTLRERLPISHFLQHLFNNVSSWSNHYGSG
jgi:transposase-like protein